MEVRTEGDSTSPHFTIPALGQKVVQVLQVYKSHAPTNNAPTTPHLHSHIPPVPKHNQSTTHPIIRRRPCPTTPSPTPLTIRIRIPSKSLRLCSSFTSHKKSFTGYGSGFELEESGDWGSGGTEGLGADQVWGLGVGGEGHGFLGF